MASPFMCSVTEEPADKMPLENHFQWLDYIVLSLVLLVSCVIGLYHAWNNQNEAEYLLGNRQMKWWPVALSLIVTFYSGISQIGKPAEIYLYGVQFSVGIIGIALCMLFVMFTFLPLLFNLKLTSSYEVSLVPKRNQIGSRLFLCSMFQCIAYAN